MLKPPHSLHGLRLIVLAQELCATLLSSGQRVFFTSDLRIFFFGKLNGLLWSRHRAVREGRAAAAAR